MNREEKIKEGKKEIEKHKVISYLAEKDLYTMLLEMGNSPSAIIKFQKNRVLQTFLVFLLMIISAYFLGVMFYILILIAPAIIYKQKYKRVEQMYRLWRFERHLQFTKFTRLLIPYLKQGQGEVSLYTVFNKILQRTKKDEDRSTLYQLMSEMTDKPNDITPFIDFAERSSGTDMSVLFMSTVFDFQQNTKDSSVIDELGRISSQELMEGIDEIIEFKLKRFVFYPTKVVMTSFLIVVGYAAAVLWYNIQGIQL